MGRPKIHKSKKGKIKTLILSDVAAKMFLEVRKQNKHFDFSEWVSRKVVQEFRGDKGMRLRLQIYELQQERDDIYNDFSNRIQSLAIQLNSLNDRKHQKSLEVYSEVE